MVSVRVRNTGERAGIDVVQLYARDEVASVVRPVAQLVGYARVALEPGESAWVHFDVPAARFAFTGRRAVKIVEPGEVTLWVGPSCIERETATVMTLQGPVHAVTAADARVVGVQITR